MIWIMGGKIGGDKIIILTIIIHRLFSSEDNITDIILASPGSTKSTGRSPWSVKMLRLAPASNKNLQK